MTFPSSETVKRVREKYPAGTRVELEYMKDPQAPPVGTWGTVYAVDDTASLCVHWDNGSGLNVVYGEDRVRKLEVTTVCYGQTREWSSRRDAMDYFLQGIISTEGSEQERYAKIYAELQTCFRLCTDEDDR
ncbi:MAG: DUF4314 domain-containing protein [Clostridiales bacterium]|nr:DUF4314 domain-containing protein [Clostridiales bacterium]